MPFDWSTVNTALLLGALGYLWRQSRIVDSMRQSVFGIDGRGGLIEEMKMLRTRTHDLSNTMTTLTLMVEILNKTLAAKP